MSDKNKKLDLYTRRKGTMTVLLVALVMAVLWMILLRMSLFAPVLGVLVPLALKKGYEYICEGRIAYERHVLIDVVSFVVAVIGTVGGYWLIFSAAYPDVIFFAVPYAMFDIFTGMPEYGFRFLIYLGIGIVCTFFGILAFMKKPK